MEGSTIEKFKIYLLARRNQLLMNLERERELKKQLEVTTNQAEIVDMAQALEQIERDASLAEQGHRELTAINIALKKISNGSFGVCEECEEDIPHRRLQVMPQARFCADCQTAFEEETRPRPFRANTGIAA